jgi:hypothetical protein
MFTRRLSSSFKHTTQVCENCTSRTSSYKASPLTLPEGPHTLTQRTTTSIFALVDCQHAGATAPNTRQSHEYSSENDLDLVILDRGASTRLALFEE